MRSRMAFPMILSGLILLTSGLRAGAQDQDLGKLTADARAAHQAGKYSDALTLYKHALAIQEKMLGPSHPDVAITLNNLAVIYQDEYLDSQAEPLYKQALAIWEKTPGADAQAANCMANLADLYRDDHKGAAGRAALQSRVKDLGENRAVRAHLLQSQRSPAWGIFTTPSKRIPRPNHSTFKRSQAGKKPAKWAPLTRHAPSQD